MATCQILFSYIFYKIKWKTSVEANTMEKLIKRIIKRAECDNIYKILVCMSTIDRPKRLIRVVNNTKLSENIRKAMLVYNDLQLYVVVLDQENIDIPSKKPSY